MNLPSFIAGVLVGIISCGAFVLTLIAKKMPGVTRYRRRPLSRADVINAVFDKIDAASPEEFARQLARHRDGPIVHAFSPREPDMADVAGIGDREQPLYMYGVMGLGDE